MTRKEVDVELALKLLRRHHLDHTRELLQAHGLPASGNAAELGRCVAANISRGHIGADAVVAALDVAEGSGHQHVLVFRTSTDLLSTLRNDDHINAAAREARLESLLNKTSRILALPANPTCTAIRTSAREIRIKWTETRKWRERTAVDRRNDREVEVYMIRKSRAVNILRIDRDSGLVELRLSDVGRRTRKDYETLYAQYSNEARWLVDLEALERVELSKAIPRILAVPEQVRPRANMFVTPRGTRAEFISDSSSTDLFADPLYSSATGGEPTPFDHRRLNAYWLANESASSKKEIHTYLYGDGMGNEVRFPTDISDEREIDVLRRIAEFAEA